jgi:hypothetical protein
MSSIGRPSNFPKPGTWSAKFAMFAIAFAAFSLAGFVWWFAAIIGAFAFVLAQIALGSVPS